MSCRRRANRGFEGCDEFLHDAVLALELKQQKGIPLTRNVAYHLLQECEETKKPEYGIRVQSLMVHAGLHSVAVLCDHLIRIFTYQRSLVAANQTFNNVSNPTAHTWAAIILANSKLGQGYLALQLYYRMQLSDVKSDAYVHIAILQACAATQSPFLGKLIHEDILSTGFKCGVAVGTTLIDMYAKCSSIEEASKALAWLPSRNVVSWNAMIAGYVHYGQIHEAVTCLEKMQIEGLEPSVVSWNTILAGYAQHGEAILAQTCLKKMQELGIKPNVVSWNTILAGHAQRGKWFHAVECFKSIQKEGIDPSAVSWNTMIGGYAQYGRGALALEFFEKMKQNCLKPDEVTFSSALKACTSLEAVEYGRLIHEKMLHCLVPFDAVAGSTLVDMYSKCGRLKEAQGIFEKLTVQNVVSWTAMIAGYAQHGDLALAVECFEKMQQKGIKANVVSWGAIIGGYARCEESLQVFRYFHKMQQEGIMPDGVIFLSVLKACICLGTVQQGRSVHVQVIESGYQLDVHVGGALVDMYIKCGSLEEACRVFKKVPIRDTVLWGIMIAGYVTFEEDSMALDHFDMMQLENMTPNELTFLNIFKLCASMGMVEQGRFMHEHIMKSELPLDAALGNLIIDMYCKCGNLGEAWNAFCRLSSLNILSWNTMITGFALHGECILALEVVENMQQEGIKLDQVSFAAMLAACCHAGLIEEGWWYFNIMKEGHAVTPSVCHCSCMVDMLGRAGYLAIAENLLLRTMEHDIRGWTSLLSSCRLYRAVETGNRCFNQIISINSACAAGHVLMSNILVDAYVQVVRKYAVQ